MGIQSSINLEEFKFKTIMEKIEVLENVEKFVIVEFYPLSGPVNNVYTITIGDFKRYFQIFFNEGNLVDVRLCDFIENIENRYVTTRMEDIVYCLEKECCRQIKTYEQFKFMMNDHVFLSNFKLYALAEKE